MGHYVSENKLHNIKENHGRAWTPTTLPLATVWPQAARRPSPFPLCGMASRSGGAPVTARSQAAVATPPRICDRHAAPATAQTSQWPRLGPPVLRDEVDDSKSDKSQIHLPCLISTEIWSTVLHNNQLFLEVTSVLLVFFIT